MKSSVMAVWGVFLIAVVCSVPVRASQETPDGVAADGEELVQPDIPPNPAITRLTPWPAGTLNLKEIPYRIIHETYRETNGKLNWELYTMKPDGSDVVNLTNTPDVDEMYPHVTPDGTKICYVVDEGQGRNRVRCVYYMNIDGTHRTKVSDHAREPCWSWDGKTIAYLNDEFERYSTREYATDGLMFYHIENGVRAPHANSQLNHLYAICWSPDAKWFLAPVAGGMGYSDAIMAFEAYGTRVFPLAKFGVKGCRPDFAADGKHMVWGETDWNLKIGDINTAGSEPNVTNIREILRCAGNYKVYHVDISPDQKWITFSYGLFEGGQQVGGFAEGWNICVGEVATGKWVQITSNGFHNKEPDWYIVKK
jgi:Tol biopolymer transport system component